MIIFRLLDERGFFQAGMRCVLKIRLILLILATAPWVAGPALAERREVEIVDYGEFRTEDVGTRKAPDTTKGSIHAVAQYTLLRRTTCIRGELGVTFGVTLRGIAPAAASRPARIEIHHPPFKGPDGAVRTVQAWPMTLDSTPLYTGWSFEQPYEIAIGRWTVDVVRDGRLLARQGFDVIRPDEGCPAEVSSADRLR